MAVAPDALTEIRDEAEEILTDPSLSASVRVAKLTLLRDRLSSLQGEVEKFIGDQRLLQEAEAGESARRYLAMRASADARDRLLADGFDAGELDAQGFLSHTEIDHLAEEGLLEEGLRGWLERLHPRKRAGGGHGGEFIDKLVHIDGMAYHDDVSVPGSPPITPAALRTIKERHLDSITKLWKGEKAQQVFSREVDSREKHWVGFGVYSAERHRLHRAIMEQLLEGHAPQDAPEVLFMAGGPASGKSVALRADPSLKPPDAADLNPDAVMELLPEYGQLLGDPYLAYGLHEEAADVARYALEEALARRLNMLIDGVGDSEPGKWVGKIRALKAAGYKTRVVMVDTDLNTAISRSVERATVEGSPDHNRFVPVATMKNLHRGAAARMEEWLRDPAVDKFQVWSTAGAWGSAGGSLVASGGGGRVEVHDPARLDAIRAKAFLV